MEKQLQVGVKILLQNKEGKFLLLQRNLKKYPEVKKNDSLDIVGGRIEIGVPLMENLRREIFEETKLTLTEEPRLLAAQDILRPDKHVVRLTYIAHVEGEPVLDEDHDSYTWLSAEEIKNTEGLDQYFKEVFNKFIYAAHS
jgi:ADP-ribose pyrophosphatase YjhB (NUDIX family)